MNAPVTLEQWVDLEEYLDEYFWIRPLFFGLLRLEPESISSEWETVYNHVLQHVGYLVADEETFSKNLRYLRLEMLSGQKETLRKTISTSLSQLKKEIESEDGNLSVGRLKNILDRLPSNFPDWQKDNIYTHHFRTEFYLLNAVLRLKEAKEVLDGTHNNRESTPPPAPEKDNKTQGPRGTYNTQKQQAVDLFKSLVTEAINKELRDSRTPVKEKIITKAYNTLRDQKQSNGVKKYPESTLRSWFPVSYKEGLYDEIQRYVSKINTLRNR